MQEETHNPRYDAGDADESDVEKAFDQWLDLREVQLELSKHWYEALKAEAAARGTPAEAATDAAEDVARSAWQSTAKATREAYEAFEDAHRDAKWGTDEDAMADALRAVPAEDAGDVEHIEMPPELAREQAAPIKGDSSSRLMDGGREALPTEDLRDEAFSGDEGEGAPAATAAAAAPAAATEGVEIEMPPDYAGWAGAQEPNDAPDAWGGAAKPGGSEGLGQEQPSGEGPTAAPTDQGGSPFFGVDETGPLAGDVFDHEQDTAEGVEIEMPPDPAEPEMPPEDHFEDVV